MTRLFVLLGLTLDALVLAASPVAHAQEASEPAAQQTPAAEPASTTTGGDALRLAKELAADGRTDEAVAVLMGLVDHPTHGPAASEQLRKILLTTAPRRAWASAYDAALRTAPQDARHGLMVRAARADLQDPDTRDGALRRLQALLEERPKDAELRLATAEALLEAGRFEQARAVVAGKGSKPMRHVEVAALVALDRLDEARKVEGADVPTACATAGTPAACASGLEDMGYPGAAAAMLRAAIRSGDRDLRTPTAKAAAWARVAAIEESRGELVLALRAWRRASQLSPDNRVYSDRLTNLLANTGRAEEAERIAGDSDPKTAASMRAVRLATSVNPGEKSDRVDQAIAKARELDPDHPLVVQAYAHWLITRGRPEEALRALEPYLDQRVTNPGFLDLYVWAAGESDKPEQAADAVQRALSAVRNPRRWQDRFALLANLQTFAAERAKDRKDLAEAESRYRLAHAADPTSIRVLVGLAGVLWERGKTREAAVYYRRALEVAPGNRTALFALVELLKTHNREGAARRILLESGYDDLKVRQLEAELAAMQQAQPARRLRAQGRLDEALAAYAAVVARHPEQPALLHAYADTLAEAGRLVEAAETYAKARELEPDNPWLKLGEINALAGLQQPAEARILLGTLAEPGTDALKADIARAERNIEQAEVAILLQQGRDDEAVEIIGGWLAGDADAEVYTAVGDLYLSRWQQDVARLWYLEALEKDPDHDPATRGLVRSNLALGRFKAAERRVSALVERSPTSANTALAREVARRQALQSAVQAAARGDNLRAERIILDLVERHPDDLNLRVAHARLLLMRGEPEVALREAQGVLTVEPTNAEALSVVSTAAIELGRSEEALAAYEAAVAAGGPAWLTDATGTLRLAARLDRARKQHRVGPQEAAEATIREATRYYGTDDANRWVLIGGAWLDIKRPKEAVSAFEMARRAEPLNAGAAVGLAGAWETLGQPSRAESILTAHWERTRSPTTGLALADLQKRRGQTDAARRTIRQLQDEAGDDDVVVYADSAPPRPLKVVTPEGRDLDDASAQRDPSRTSWSAVDVSTLSAKDPNDTPVDIALGGGWLGRPGNAGEQFLNVLYLPLAAGIDLPGPVDLQGEVVGVQLNDGVRQAGGASMSAGLVTGLPGGFGVQARLGRDAVVSDGFQPMTTWFVAADGELLGGLKAQAQAGKAPVTDTLTSWAGSYSAQGVPFGRVYDTWAGAELAYGFSNGSNIGVVGRVGHADDADEQGPMGQVPWRQVVGYGRTLLLDEDRRTTWAGFEAIVLDHDRQVDGFTPGQGGMFTPDFFATLIARIEMAWRPEQGRWSACGLAGAGPQVVQGEQTLYLFPGTYVAYQLQGTVQAELGRQFSLLGHAMHAGSFGAWGQTGVFAQLRYGAQADLGSPSPIFGSLIHGPPLSQPAACPTQPRTEVRR